MRARAAAKTGISLTLEPRAEKIESPNRDDRRLARQAAWGALLVSAAAIAGYLAEEILFPDAAPESRASPTVVESTGIGQIDGS